MAGCPEVPQKDRPGEFRCRALHVRCRTLEAIVVYGPIFVRRAADRTRFSVEFLSSRKFALPYASLEGLRPLKVARIGIASRIGPFL